MGIAENKQVVLDFYDAGARGDMDACFALLAGKITWTNIGYTVRRQGIPDFSRPDIRESFDSSGFQSRGFLSVV